MVTRNYLPSARLALYIKHFLVIESAAHIENRILPDTSVVLAFRYKGNITINENGSVHHLDGSGITGLRNSARLISYAGDSGSILTVFRDGGAGAFFRVPQHELFGHSVSLNNFIKQSSLSQVEERLSYASSTKDRIAVIEQFLLSQLQPPETDLLIHAAVEQIRTAKGNIRIDQLADSLFISRDAFEKRFRKHIGASPKQFAGIVRLRDIIHAFSHSHTLTATALEAGYFDQSHFIKDFKSFTGLSPRTFFKSPVFW